MLKQFKELCTIMQQSCKQWREQWNRHITPSIFHDVYVRKESTHPGSLLKHVKGYEQNDLSYIPAVNWGFRMRLMYGNSTPL